MLRSGTTIPHSRSPRPAKSRVLEIGRAVRNVVGSKVLILLHSRK